MAYHLINETGNVHRIAQTEVVRDYWLSKGYVLKQEPKKEPKKKVSVKAHDGD